MHGDAWLPPPGEPIAVRAVAIGARVLTKPGGRRQLSVSVPALSRGYDIPTHVGGDKLFAVEIRSKANDYRHASRGGQATKIRVAAPEPVPQTDAVAAGWTCR